jgi:hypothetical protein
LSHNILKAFIKIRRSVYREFATIFIEKTNTLELIKLLSGGDLRSIGNNNSLVDAIKDQEHFDRLFKCLFYKDRIVVMRAADAIEKITIANPSYLSKHKTQILKFVDTAVDKEFKWHLALLIPRMKFDKKEFIKIWGIMLMWAKDKSNSRIVRVNSLQALFELAKQEISLLPQFNLVLQQMEKENIPSLNARIRNIRKGFKFKV